MKSFSSKTLVSPRRDMINLPQLCVPRLFAFVSIQCAWDNISTYRNFFSFKKFVFGNQNCTVRKQRSTLLSFRTISYLFVH